MKYDAFISYSHAADGRLAPALQKGLHHFAKPWYRMRALHVFRDETSLSATPELWPTIEAALANSRYFILLAAPEAAASLWVRREIEWWLGNRGTAEMLIALTDGSIVWNRGRGDFDWHQTTGLPDMLRSRFSDEPLYVDLRWARSADDISLRNQKFAEAVSNLAAPLHGKSKDELIGEDVRQHRRTRLVGATAVAAIIIFAIVAVWEAFVAERRRTVAVSRQLAAQALSYVEEQPDLALLLSLEANRLASSLEVRSSLLTAIQNKPQLLTFLHDPSGRHFYDLVFSPDGRRLAAGALYGYAVLWDLQSRQVVAKVESKIVNNTADSVAISPDARRVAFGGYNGTIELWDLLERRKLAGPIQAHKSHVALQFSPDGTTLASSDDDGTLRLWDGLTGQAQRRIEAKYTLNPTFSIDGRRLATNGEDWIVIQDLDSSESISWQIGRRPPITKLAFSPEGGTLASVIANDLAIVLWDSSSGQQIRSPLLGHTFLINDLAFSPDAKTLASASDDNTVVLWNLMTSPPDPVRIRGHVRPVKSLQFSPSGKILASASDRIMLLDLDRHHRLARKLLGPGGRVGKIALINHDGTRLIGAGEAGLVIWDLLEGRATRFLSDTYHGWMVAASPDGRFVARGGGNDVITLWDVANDRLIRRIQTGYRFNMGDIAFNSDGSILASTGNNHADLWDVASGSRLDVDLKGHSQWVTAIAFTPDGRVMASGGGDGVILWNTNGWVPLGRIEGPAQTIAFSPDGEYLVTGYYQKVALWKVSDRSSVGPPLIGHSGSVGAFAFSPDGQALASGGSDQTIIFWDLPTRKILGHLRGIGGRINDLVFTPNGKTLIGAGDGIILWDMDLSSWKTLACSVANRNMTKDEWESFLPDERYHETCGGQRGRP